MEDSLIYSLIEDTNQPNLCSHWASNSTNNIDGVESEMITGKSGASPLDFYAEDYLDGGFIDRLLSGNLEQNSIRERHRCNPREDENGRYGGSLGRSRNVLSGRWRILN